MVSAENLFTDGQRLTLHLESWGHGGETLARYQSRKIRVYGGIPGEDVVAELVQTRHHEDVAKVVEVMTPSPYRISPPCLYFWPCTGCQWQHVAYSHQLELKKALVEAALKQAGFTVPPVGDTLASPQQYGYRNHVRFNIGRQGSLCFTNHETRERVNIEKCLLMHPWINETIHRLQGRCGETTELSIRYGVNTSDFLIQPFLARPAISLRSGQEYYEECVLGHKFRIASPSFFQVNIAQAERMVQFIRESLQLYGDEFLLDAYAGVGTFSILLASQVKKLLAVESSPAAIKDARVNAKGLEHKIEFMTQTTEYVLARLKEIPHAVILDPSRTGCERRALQALIELKPPRLVYVSCEPSTLARDLKILCEKAFVLEKIQPIDMFPQTHHVECVALLSLHRRRVTLSPLQSEAQTAIPETPLVLASVSPRRKELLASLGLNFTVMRPETKETVVPGETPPQLVERLALLKAQSVSGVVKNGLILGADCVVSLDGKILGKPATPEEAESMLKALRGREHHVITGVALLNAASQKYCVSSLTSTVTMRVFSDEEIARYVSSGEPMDKAGAYAIQDEVFRPASHWTNCYTNIVGLPLCVVVKLLAHMGIDCDFTTPPKSIQRCVHCPLSKR